MNAAAPSIPVERLTLNTRDACSAIGVCPATLWRLEKRGLIKAVPGLRHKLYSVASLKHFVNGSAKAV